MVLALSAVNPAFMSVKEKERAAHTDKRLFLVLSSIEIKWIKLSWFGFQHVSRKVVAIKGVTL